MATLKDDERKRRLVNSPRHMHDWFAPKGLGQRIEGYANGPCDELPLSSLLDPGVLLNLIEKSLSGLEKSHFGIVCFKVPEEHRCIFFNKTEKYNEPEKLEKHLSKSIMHLHEYSQKFDPQKSQISYVDNEGVSGDIFFRDCITPGISFPNVGSSDEMKDGNEYFPSVFQHEIEDLRIVNDKVGSLMTPDRRASVTTLKDMGRIFEFLGKPQHDFTVEGVSREHLIISPPGSVFGMHIEDWGLAALNFCHLGGPKVWFSVSCQFFEAVVAFLKHRFQLKHVHPILKKLYFVDPVELMEAGIPVQRVVQLPGTMVVVDCYAFHWGYNAGRNVVEAVNLVLPHYFRVRKPETPLTKACKLPACQEWFSDSKTLIQTRLNQMTHIEFQQVLVDWMEAKKKELPVDSLVMLDVEDCGGRGAKRRTNLLRKLAFQLPLETGRKFLEGDNPMAIQMRHEAKSPWAIHQPFRLEDVSIGPGPSTSGTTVSPSRHRQETSPLLKRQKKT